MKKRVLAMLMATVMVAGAMTGCGSTDTTTPSTDTETTTDDAGDTTDAGSTEVEQVSLKIWTPENQRTNGTIESMAESFQALHPEYEISFTFEIVGEDVVKDEVMKDVENAADVFFYANDQMVELVNAGALAKLGGTTLDMINSTMSEAVVGTVTNPNDGDIYGIPFTHNTYFMYYDKTLLTEDDVKTLEGIIEKDLGDGVTNFYLDSAGGWKLASWYYGAGCTIFGSSQADLTAGCDWNQDTGIAVTNYLIDMNANPKVAFDNGINPTEFISEHKLGAWFDGSWNYQTYLDVLGDDLGLAVIPTYDLNGTTNQLKGFYGSKAIGVNTHSKALPVAVQFAAYLGSEEMQIQRFIESGQIPTNQAAGEIDEVKADPVAAVMVAEANNASVTQPLVAEFGSIYWSNILGVVEEIKSGDLTKDNVQEKMDAFASFFVIE